MKPCPDPFDHLRLHVLSWRIVIGSHDVENCTSALLRLFPKVEAWPCASTIFTCDPKSCHRTIMGMVYSCMDVPLPNVPAGHRWANLKLTVEIAETMVAAFKRHNWCNADEVFFDQPGEHMDIKNAKRNRQLTLPCQYCSILETLQLRRLACLEGREVARRWGTGSAGRSLTAFPRRSS
jgi:hypothetical protein